MAIVIFYPENVSSLLTAALEEAAGVRKQAIREWMKVRDEDRKVVAALKRLYDEADTLPEIQKEVRRNRIDARRKESRTAVVKAKVAIDKADADWLETHTMCVYWAKELRALTCL